MRLKDTNMKDRAVPDERHRTTAEEIVSTLIRDAPGLTALSVRVLDLYNMMAVLKFARKELIRGDARQYASRTMLLKMDHGILPSGHSGYIWSLNGPKATIFTPDDGIFNNQTGLDLCAAVYANHIRVATNILTERMMGVSCFSGPGEKDVKGMLGTTPVEALIRRGVLIQFGDPVEKMGMRFQKWRFNERCLHP